MSQWIRSSHSYLSDNEAEVLDIGHGIDLLAEDQGFAIWFGWEYTIHSNYPRDIVGIEENKRLCLEKAEEIMLQMLNNIRSAK